MTLRAGPRCTHLPRSTHVVVEAAPTRTSGGHLLGIETRGPLVEQVKRLGDQRWQPLTSTSHQPAALRDSHRAQRDSGKDPRPRVEVPLDTETAGESGGDPVLPLRLDLEASGADGRRRDHEIHALEDPFALTLVVLGDLQECAPDRHRGHLLDKARRQHLREPRQPRLEVPEDHVLLGGEVVEEGALGVVMGLLHFVLPAGIPGPLSWMYDLPPWAHYVSGAAEIAGGLGLVLPGWTRILPWLTPLAASGLALVMVGAVVWHAGRGEIRNVVTNLVVAGVLGFIAIVRWRRHPLPARSDLTDPGVAPAGEDV